MPYLIGATAGHGCKIAITSDSRHADVVWVGAGHRDELLENHVANQVLMCLAKSHGSDAPQLRTILFEVESGLKKIERSKVSFCCAAVRLDSESLTCWVAGTRFTIFRRGEWLVAEPRSIENPHLRGFEGASIKDGTLFSAVTCTIQIPISSAAGISLTDAANLRRKSVEPVLRKIANDRVSDSGVLAGMLMSAVQDQDSAIVTVVG